jgi:hypothetical protein
LKAVISYLKRVATWGWQGRHVYSGALLGFGLPIIVAVIHPSEFAFRLVGFFLQVLGVWIVWKGIRGTRDQFEVPSSWAETKAWLAGFPRFRGRTVVAVGAAAIGVSVGSARAYVWSGVPDGATVEQRVDAIEKNVRRVREDLSAHQREADDRARAHDKEMKRERSEREVADRAIHEKIKESETGGLKLNAAGVWWLFSGTLCSTFPGEIAGFFGGS